ncbi:hypothetical protein ACFYS8_18860 [Kitasatospora sp. NPDC004615]|uniref:hypothetical protein n=1 Tax=Kitasatospora sp. NPDC004615 TaxID=3364017 RepID=UPI003695CC70
MALRIDRVLADRPFAEVGTPRVAVVDERRGLLAVAGYVRRGRPAPMAVYRTSDLTCVAVLRSRFPVNALAFHPELPLLAVGTGEYDGGLLNRGELLLLDLESGSAVSAFRDPNGRTVREVEWLDGQSLRLYLEPVMKDSWVPQVEHLVDLHRTDWRALEPRSVRGAELGNSRTRPLAAHRPPDPAALLDRYGPGRDLRSLVHEVELLDDGRLLASLDGVLLECRLPSGELSWSVPVIACGGMQLAVAPDQRSAWVHAGPWHVSGVPDSVSRIDLSNGTRTARVRLSAPAGLHLGPDGLPVLVPRGGLRVRRGGGTLTTTFRAPEGPGRESERWVGATAPVPLPGAEEPFVPGSPPVGEPGRLLEPVWAPPHPLFPLALAPGEDHDGGPGVELPGGDLLQAGARWRREGRRPGDCYVARRDPADGATRWVFRTDRPAVVLDTDDTAAYAGYENGDLLALSLADGTLREWVRLTLRGAPLVPTALTVTAPGRLLVGTECGRLLDCTLA